MWEQLRPRALLHVFLAFATISGSYWHTAARPLIDTALPLSEVIWRPEGITEFVGSPSICRLPNGTYLASHDDFGLGGVSDSVSAVIERRTERKTLELAASCQRVDCALEALTKFHMEYQQLSRQSLGSTMRRRWQSRCTCMRPKTRASPGTLSRR